MSKSRTKDGPTDNSRNPKKMAKQESKKAHKTYLNRIKTLGPEDDESDFYFEEE
ncbi:MAG: hypothetical protein WD577_06700 [Bacteroidales bacterium]